MLRDKNMGRNGTNVIHMREIALIKSQLRARSKSESVSKVIFNPSCTLHDLLSSKQNFLNESRVKYIFSQILNGMQYLKEKNMAHGNLMPSQIVLDLIHCKASLKIETNPAICRWYQSPEQLCGTVSSSSSSDLFSFGIILLETNLKLENRRGKMANLRADSNLHQLDSWLQALGKPDKMTENETLKTYFLEVRERFFEFSKATSLEIMLQSSDWHLVTLLRKLLTFCPNLRKSAQDILMSESYFS